MDRSEVTRVGPRSYGSLASPTPVPDQARMPLSDEYRNDGLMLTLKLIARYRELSPLQITYLARCLAHSLCRSLGPRPTSDCSEP